LAAEDIPDMARPRRATPTEGELEILHVLWESGPATVREVLESLSADRPRAYTSVMTLLNVMVDKGLVVRERRGRAFVYRARKPREQTLGKLISDLLRRAFRGSASSLVAHMLDQTKPSSEELQEIERLIASYKRSEEG
jgi:predicted transcriptional regulator